MARTLLPIFVPPVVRPLHSLHRLVRARAPQGLLVVAFAVGACAPPAVRPASISAQAIDESEARAGYQHGSIVPSLGETVGASMLVAPAPASLLPARSILPSMRDVTLLVDEGAIRCPQDMALVGGRVCIDRWEASVVRRVGEREEAWSPFVPLDGVAGYRAVSRGGVVPQGYVSGEQAEVACRASGKRLCTPGEWQVACKGIRNTPYPYGAERAAHTCNDDGRASHPVLEAARRAGVRSDRLWTDGMNLPEINQLPDGLLASGARAECVSDEGVFDMVGNLHEWVADAEGTFRGGFYMDTSQNGEGCAYQTTAHDFSYHDYSTGFRCCADPDAIE